MDCVSPILDVATRLWNCTSQSAAYVRELERNLKILKGTMEELKNLSKDVMERVEREEELQQSRRTHEVDGWLHAVQSLGAEVEEISHNGDQEIQKKCLRICPKNCWSNYKLGKIVTQKIDEVVVLMGKGHFDFVTHGLPCAPADERPMGKTVGLDLMFEKVQRCLVDEQGRSIGLFGMGGATLLQKINNDFFGKRSDFDVVIWVVVSRPINIEKIQEVILKKLQVPDDIRKGSSKEEKAVQIFKLLKAKKFVVLLDDMWERLDLLEVGIPPLNDQTKSKVVLTTRSEQVCDAMGVHHKFRVECLTTDEAFSLFCDNVGENIMKSHPDIETLAKTVVEECKGLPLALVVIARSMASRKTPQEWEQAIDVLRSYPAKFSGMGDQIFPILKFSYDHLDSSTKACFLYCSLFPEDYDFEEQDLINLWIGEGFLNNCDDIYEARNQGNVIIRSLKLTCLLESGIKKNTCKMHDMIRDMGQWLSCDHGEKERKNDVVEHVELIKEFEIVRWEDAYLILLWHSNFKETLSISPYFPNLQTFIMRSSSMKSLPIGFFHFAPTIRVLDLSCNLDLEEFPSEICRLESLEYLNLARTSIKRLPTELKELEKLKCLILDRMYGLQALSPNVISCLLNLRMFSMMTHFGRGIEGYEECLQELECLPCLSEISISLKTSSAVKKFITSQKLPKCVWYLSMNRCKGLKLLELPLSTLQRLKVLRFNFCKDLEGVQINKQSEEKQRSMSPFHISNSYFHSLVNVNIGSCEFVDLTWLIYAPCLEVLSISFCPKIKEIIAANECRQSEIEEHLNIFSRLASLSLCDLPNLESIYRRPLSFPSLTKIKVISCPNLRKLPLNSNSSTNTLETIEGDSRWWKGLEWENDHLKSTFTPYFKSWDA